MKWNITDEYTNISSFIVITEMHGNQECQYQYEKVKCPTCQNEGWLDNGDIKDLTQSCVECVKCNVCGHEFFLTYFEEWANSGEFPTDPTILESIDAFPRLQKQFN